jgi:hypothetical protein
MHAAAAGQLVGAEVTGIQPDGTSLPDKAGGIGNVAYDQSFSDQRSSAISTTLTTVAGTLGFKVIDVRVLHPLQAAPAVVVKVPDPANFVAGADEAIARLFGTPPSFEGYYFEADDGSGSPIFIQATSFRAGVGLRWVRPDLNTRRIQNPPVTIEGQG